MFRRFTTVVTQTRGIKHQVKVKWVRPAFVPNYNPEKAGDLEPKTRISSNTLGEIYAQCDEIKDAPESVKKLFSAAFLGKKEEHSLVKKELIDRVKRYEYDSNTAETRIARLTGNIRNFQELMEKFPQNRKAKKIVLEMCNKRKQLLKFLRQYDYKKFEWLLEQLNIEYKGHPDTYHKLSRKESIKKLTELYCEEIKNNKLADYRNMLESQQGPFLQEKLDALKFIRSEQLELRLSVTVTEGDIKKVEEQLQEWKVKDEIKQQAKKKKRNLIDVETDV